MLKLLTDLRGLPVWLAVGVLLGVAAARFPAIGFAAVAALVAGVVGGFVVILAAPKKILPKFSLLTMLLVVGLIGCFISLQNEGEPWSLAHQFAGHEVNIAMSPDGSLVAASQGTSIEIRETRSGKSLATLDLPPKEAAAKAGSKWS